MQRVALARALVKRPKVLLLDEPLGALDLKLRTQMQLELKRIQREVGTTFIYVTHDQGEAMTMSDRIAVMNKGRIEQIGTPQEIYDRPATRFVAGFIGNANIAAGRRSRAVHDGERERSRCGGLAFAVARRRRPSRPVTAHLALRYERIRLGQRGRTMPVTHAGRGARRDLRRFGRAVRAVARQGPLELIAEAPHEGGARAAARAGEPCRIGWDAGRAAPVSGWMR